MGWGRGGGDSEAGNDFLVLGRLLGHEGPVTQGQTPGSQESRGHRRRAGSHRKLEGGRVWEPSSFFSFNRLGVVLQMKASRTRIISQMQPQIIFPEIRPIRDPLGREASC